MTRVPKRVYLVIDADGWRVDQPRMTLADARLAKRSADEAYGRGHTVHAYALVEPTPKPRGKAKGRRRG
jgi:hypothetical protein